MRTKIFKTRAEMWWLITALLTGQLVYWTIIVMLHPALAAACGASCLCILVSWGVMTYCMGYERRKRAAREQSERSHDWETFK